MTGHGLKWCLIAMGAQGSGAAGWEAHAIEPGRCQALLTKSDYEDEDDEECGGH
jgi:hypothetical protein